MRIRLWPTAAGVVLTAALFTAPCAVLEWFRADAVRTGVPVPPAWALLCLTCALAALAALLAVLLARRRFSRQLHDLAGRITAVQKNPSPQLVQPDAAHAD